MVLLAVACGATVANLYYAQPLLDTIARELDVSSGTAGLLVTATQFGYVGGLLFIVPLGDLLQRRTLVSEARAVVPHAAAVWERRRQRRVEPCDTPKAEKRGSIAKVARDARGVDVPMASNLICVMLSFLKPLLCNSHKNRDYSIITGFWYGSRGAFVV